MNAPQRPLNAVMDSWPLAGVRGRTLERTQTCVCDRSDAMVREHAAAVPLSDVNTTPLIDIMLVLLIIFMIAAPVLSHRLPLQNRQPGPRTTQVEQRHEIGVEGDAAQVQLTLDGVPVAHSTLAARLREAGGLPKDRQPEFRIVAGGEVRFETVAMLMAVGKRAGVERVGLE